MGFSHWAQKTGSLAKLEYLVDKFHRESRILSNPRRTVLAKTSTTYMLRIHFLPAVHFSHAVGRSQIILAENQ